MIRKLGWFVITLVALACMTVTAMMVYSMMK